MTPRPAFLMCMLLPPLVAAAAACSKLSADNASYYERRPETGTVSISLTEKSSLSDIENGVIFALDENGEVVQKDSLRCDGNGKTDWTLAAGIYRIWCVVNASETSRASLWECGCEEEIGQVAFPMDGQESCRPLTLLTVNGDDGSFSLDSGEIKEIQLAGSPLMAKISLRNIVNRTSYGTMPAYGPVSISCLEAFLLNVPDSVTIEQDRSFALRNSMERKLIDLDNGCTHAVGSGIDIPCGGTGEENLTLYSFPNTACEGDLVLCVAVRIAGESKRWYNIPVGKVESGFEYTVNNLVIMKEGATTPFILTPTSDFITEMSATDWEDAEEDGLEGCTATGEMSFTLSHRQVFRDNPPERWNCDFTQLYGSAMIRSADPGTVCVTGAGRHWMLHPISDGCTQLELFDGLNTRHEAVCVGNSIKYGWKTCEGEDWDPSKTLYTYQRCSLEVTSSYGSPQVCLDGSVFAAVGSVFDGNLTYAYPAGNNMIVLKDYFDTLTVNFPYTLSDWNMEDCPVEISRDDATVSLSAPLRATITFPYNLSECSKVPCIRVLDIDGSCETYGISISSSMGKNSMTASAEIDGVRRECDDLDIKVYCMLGGKMAKLMDINKVVIFEK